MKQYKYLNHRLNFIFNKIKITFILCFILNNKSHRVLKTSLGMFQIHCNNSMHPSMLDIKSSGKSAKNILSFFIMLKLNFYFE